MSVPSVTTSLQIWWNMINACQLTLKKTQRQRFVFWISWNLHHLLLLPLPLPLLFLSLLLSIFCFVVWFIESLIHTCSSHKLPLCSNLYKIYWNFHERVENKSEMQRNARIHEIHSSSSDVDVGIDSGIGIVVAASEVVKPDFLFGRSCVAL